MITAVLPSKKSWPTFWDGPFNLVASIEAAQAIIAECDRRNRVMLDHLRALRAADRQHLLHSAVRRYLASASAQVDALAKAFRKKHGPLANLSPEDLIAIVQAAPAISAWHADDGRPVAWPAWKRDGISFRWIRASNVFQYARELLTSAAAAAASAPLTTQFMSKNGGGKNRFEDWLREMLPTTKQVITIDVPRCFALMRRSSVADALPLPRKVVDQVLFVPMTRTKYLWPGPKGSCPMDMVSIAQASSSYRGISEGNALSSVASELVLATVLRDVASVGEGVRVASHGDNLIILLDDESLKEPVTHALVTSICNHFDVTPGELAGRISYSGIGSIFEFCRRHYRWASGKLRIGLPENYIDVFVNRTIAAMPAVRAQTDPTARANAVEKIERSILGWVGQSKGNPTILTEAARLLAAMPAKNPKQTAIALASSYLIIPTLHGP